MKNQATQAMELIHSSLGEHSISYTAIKKWFARFCDKNFSFEESYPHSYALKKLKMKIFKFHWIEIKRKWVFSLTKANKNRRAWSYWKKKRKKIWKAKKKVDKHHKKAFQKYKSKNYSYGDHKDINKCLKACDLSPILLNIYLEEILQTDKLDYMERYLQIYEKEYEYPAPVRR